MKNKRRKLKSNSTNKDFLNATVLVKTNFPDLNKKLNDIKCDIEDLYKKYHKIRKERVITEKTKQIMVNRVNYLLGEQKKTKFRNTINKIEKQNNSNEKNELKIHVKKNSKIKNRNIEKPRLKSVERGKKYRDNILNDEKNPETSELNMTEISIIPPKFISPKNAYKNFKTPTINSNNNSEIIEVKVNGKFAKRNQNKIKNLNNKIKNKQNKTKLENKLTNNNCLPPKKSFSTNKTSYFNQIDYSIYSSSSSNIGLAKHIKNNNRNKTNNNSNNNTNSSSKIVNLLLNNFSINQVDLFKNEDQMNKSFQKTSENILKNDQKTKNNSKKIQKQKNKCSYKKTFNDIIINDNNNMVNSPSIDDTLSLKSGLHFENYYNTLNNTLITNCSANSPAFSEFSCKIGKINLNENKSNNLIYKKKIMPKCNVIMCHKANADKLNSNKEIVSNFNINDEYQKTVQFSGFDDDPGITSCVFTSQKNIENVLNKMDQTENLKDDNKFKEVFFFNNSINLNKNIKNSIYKHNTYNHNTYNHNTYSHNTYNNTDYNEPATKRLNNNCSYRVNIENKKKELLIDPLLNSQNYYNQSNYINTDNDFKKQVLNKVKLSSPMNNLKINKNSKNVTNNIDDGMNMIKVQKRKEVLENSKILENKKEKSYNTSKVSLKDINYNLDNNNVMFNPISAFKSFEKRKEKKSSSMGKDAIYFPSVGNNYI